MGNREGNIRAAVESLRRLIDVDAVSSLYETAPVGVEAQPQFLNLVVGGHTFLSPPELLTSVKAIEAEVGRTPTFRWGPREIDVDIILYGDSTWESPDLIIPHREMNRRAFVLVPLAEIAGNLIEPTVHKTINELCDAIAGRDTVRKVGVLRI